MKKNKKKLRPVYLTDEFYNDTVHVANEIHFSSFSSYVAYCLKKQNKKSTKKEHKEFIEYIKETGEGYRLKSDDDNGTCTVCDCIFIEQKGKRKVLFSPNQSQGNISRRKEIEPILDWLNKEYPSLNAKYDEGQTD